MAEGVGFEPTVGLHPQQFSRLPQSATLAPLRGRRVLGGQRQRCQPATLDRNQGDRSQRDHNQGGGADDEVRTRDIQIGNLKLYQLSYVRIPAKCSGVGGGLQASGRYFRRTNTQ